MQNFFSRSGPLSFLLAFILAVAGLVHLMEPAGFLTVMPPYIPYPLFVIYFTGVLELFAVIGLRSRPLRRTTGFWLIAYFVAITPAHLYVAMNHVPMFGIDAPAFLWGRLAFQLVFIAWAYRIAQLAGREDLQKNPPPTT